MPYIKHIPIHPGTHLKNTLEYICNPDKSDYTCGINCLDNVNASVGLFQIFEEFGVNGDGKCKPRIAHHYVQSFRAGDIISEEAYKIGIELTQIVAPGYMCHVATHTDKEHIHNHIFIFSVHPETGYKYRHNDDQYKFVQEQSDALCLENGIPIIESPKKRDLGSKEYRAIERGGSWKDKLSWDIDDAIKYAVAGSSGKEGFIAYLEAKGYIVKYQNKNISIQIPGNKAVRVDTLAKTFGNNYTKENIEARLHGQAEKFSICPDKEGPEPVKLPKHMKYGDTSRFNEYDRYINWCKNRNKETLLEAKKREPPDLDFYQYKKDKVESKPNLLHETVHRKERGIKKERGKVRSWKDKLAWDIDDAIKNAVAGSSGKEGFIAYLEAKGYIVKYQNKNISINIPGRKPIRVDSLAKSHGIEYTKESIETRLDGVPVYTCEIDMKDAGSAAAKSYKLLKPFPFIKSMSRKEGKTKDEREIEKELEDFGRSIAILLKAKKIRTAKGKWKVKEKEKKRVNIKRGERYNERIYFKGKP